MSNLSEFFPSGGGQNEANFVASGTISSGEVVILRNDGTISTVANSEATTTQFETGSMLWTASAFDSNSNKVVIAYEDNDNSAKGTAVVGTVSGSSISFGTPVVFEDGAAQNISMAFDSDSNKIVIAYEDDLNSDFGTAVVGTVSGTSISFGTPVVFSSTDCVYTTTTFDSNLNKIVIAYRDNGNSSFGTAVVGTVSGTSISFGTPVVFNSGTSTWNSAVFDSNSNKIVIAYRNTTGGDTGEAVVGTVSGTSISFGSAVTFDSDGAQYISAVFDSSTNKIVIVSRSQGALNTNAIVGTVSGTAISFGSAVTFDALFSAYTSAAYDSNTNQVFVAYRQTSEYGTNLTTAIGTVSGDSISFEPSTVISGYANDISTVFDSNSNKVVIAYRDVDSNSGTYLTGVSIVFSEDFATYTSFIGLAASDISDGASGSVNLYGGINEAQTGLTIGADYYVQDDGTLGSPTVSLPYNIVGSTYVQNFSVSSQDADPCGLAFNADGTKMFMTGLADSVSEYTLSTGFDVSTASFVDGFSVSGQASQPRGVSFSVDGTKMYIVSDATGARFIYQYTLSVGFDVSTASYDSISFDVGNEDTSPQDIAINTDGSKLFMVGSTNDSIFEYALGTSFNVSTASLTRSYSVSSQDTDPRGLSFNSDGTEMFVVGVQNADVYKYTLASAFDLTSVTFDSSFSITDQEVNPQAISWSANGRKMFVLGLSGADVNEYSTGVGSVTAAKAGQAISATTINMMDLT